MSKVNDHHRQGELEEPDVTSPSDHTHDDGPADPYDIEALRTGQGLDGYDCEEVLLSVDVRRPGPKEYFRVHPDPAYRLDAPLLLHEVAMERTYYWVAPHMRGHLSEHLTPCRLFTCSSKASPMFLWPAKLPIAGNSGRKWAESGLRCAVAAIHSWGKLQAAPRRWRLHLVAGKGQAPGPGVDG